MVSFQLAANPLNMNEALKCSHRCKSSGRTVRIDETGTKRAHKAALTSLPAHRRLPSPTPSVAYLLYLILYAL